MNRRKILTILYVVLIFVVIASCIYLMIWINSESAMCMADPINYYINKTGEDITCNCFKSGQLFNP